LFFDVRIPEKAAKLSLIAKRFGKNTQISSNNLEKSDLL